MKRSALLHALLVSFYPFIVLAQMLNGQLFTKGLSIINAPNLNSEYRAGSNIPISIEVSGNGKLPFNAFSPGSGLTTAYEEINIFLVSSQTKTNLTVSTGPSFLTDETGTVRHLNWPIPTCIQPGQYNLTFYETSKLDGQPLFIITPIPISVRNTESVPEGCNDGANEVQPQPQQDFSAKRSPFLPGGSSGSTTGTLSTITLTSGKAFPSATGDPASLTTITAVVVSPVQTASSTTWTTTATMRKQDFSGFIPVNSGYKGGLSYTCLYTITLVSFAFFFSV